MAGVFQVLAHLKKKKKIYSLFQSQQSSVEGKWEVKDTWMHNDHKLPGRLFLGMTEKTLHFFHARYNYWSSVCTVLLEILLKISVGRRRKDGLSPEARGT